ncbi:carboxymuconolactone decarboxylase family protein [Mycolicibacterium sp.]|uniref:carboxymuconolactone decarboxylase family protein n=1 Tax=Mycolicibacterium sp. TaxID=2320850 RepID=UPI001A18649D|nr:carboxymuconolactone decarboxylase family protein [Mycolicibacterium sp.]MBJ7398678.1 carboxymuconolactone decarboxylase family protein [Mycolicibacterium sp.]
MPADEIDTWLSRLTWQSPAGQQRIVGLIRTTCASAVSLPALPSELAVAQAESDAETVVADFAEQFGIDVSMVTEAQRAALTGTLGREAIGAVVQMYVADFLPRLLAGLTALGLLADWAPTDPRWDSGIDALDVVFNHLLPGIARLRSLDPVTTEVVRLRGAVAHNCRLCKSLRDSTALDSGGSESLYDEIECYEDSALLTDGHKAALRYVDALVWSPAQIAPDIAGGVRKYFTAEQSRELTLDVMRNASNKIAVALRADVPRVEEGTALYYIDADGQPVYS